MDTEATSFEARRGQPVPVVIGGYRIKRKIGEGCASEVYLANDSGGAAVALKIGKRDRRQGAALASQRFHRECMTLAAIEHDNLVRMIGYSAGGPTEYLAMEYLAGGSLRAAIGAGMAPAQALSLLRQAASGLAVLHARGIVHRDVKPENYLFRADGALVLADFGLAARLSGADSDPIPPGAGTLCYACAEQADGGTPTAAWDIYSLGVVFFEMLCGQRPFPGETAMEVRSQHLMAPIPRLQPRLAHFQPLVDGMLEKQEQRRIADGSALLVEIARVERASCQEQSSIYGAAKPLPC